MSVNAIHPYGARCVFESLGMDKNFHTLRPVYDPCFFLRASAHERCRSFAQMDADYYIKNKCVTDNAPLASAMPSNSVRS
jgi:hypothetical protein